MHAVRLFLGKKEVGPRDVPLVRAMTRFLSVSLSFGAPALAMLLVAGLSWSDGRKGAAANAGSAAVAARAITRSAGAAPHSRAISSSKLLSALRNWSGE